MAGKTVTSTVEYEIDPEGVEISADVAVHRETGDSELDYALVGSNPDGDGLVAFGFHENEFPWIPLPNDCTSTDSDGGKHE